MKLTSKGESTFMYLWVLNSSCLQFMQLPDPSTQANMEFSTGSNESKVHPRYSPTQSKHRHADMSQAIAVSFLIKLLTCFIVTNPGCGKSHVACPLRFKATDSARSVPPTLNWHCRWPLLVPQLHGPPFTQ